MRRSVLVIAVIHLSAHNSGCTQLRARDNHNNGGMKQEDPGPLKDKKVREELKQKWTPVINGGLQALDKALEINPEYDDAMAYENLLIRERADLADSKEEYEKQIKIADDWVQKALATKKIKMERKNKQTGGIVAQ